MTTRDKTCSDKTQEIHGKINKSSHIWSPYWKGHKGAKIVKHKKGQVGQDGKTNQNTHNFNRLRKKCYGRQIMASNIHNCNIYSEGENQVNGNQNMEDLALEKFPSINSERMNEPKVWKGLVPLREERIDTEWPTPKYFLV